MDCKIYKRDGNVTTEIVTVKYVTRKACLRAYKEGKEIYFCTSFPTPTLSSEELKNHAIGRNEAERFDSMYDYFKEKYQLPSVKYAVVVKKEKPNV